MARDVGSPTTGVESRLRHGEPRRDGPWSALIALVLVSLTIPAALILQGPLESNGWPGRLIAFFVAGAVLLGWIARRKARTRTSPAEVGVWLLAGGLGASVAGAGLRNLTGDEAAGVMRASLVMFPLLIISLFIAANAGRRQVDTLLAVALIGATVSAGVAILQFATPFDLASVLRLPLTTARLLGGMGSRGGFFRVKGAAAHPIEFGVISAAVVPIGMHYFRFARTRANRLLAAAATALLLAAIPMSVSRSGILAVAIAVLVYGVVLSNRQRISVLVLGLAAVLLARAAVPGLLGTVRSFFVNASTDDSISGRTNDYALIAALFGQSPFVGRGLGTFRPEDYFFLDNQYLLSAVEGGVVLLLATILFFLLTIASARGAAMRAATASEASRAQAITAAVLAIGVSGAFFDLFSFAQVTVLTFVLAGLAGAVWRLSLETGSRIPTPLERVRGSRVAMAAGLFAARHPESATLTPESSTSGRR